MRSLKCSSISSCGCCMTNADRCLASTCWPHETGAVRRIFPLRPPLEVACKSLTFSSATLACATARWAKSRYSSPALVRAILRVLRLNKVVFTLASRLATRLLMALLGSPSALPAVLTLKYLATSTKALKVSTETVIVALSDTKSSYFSAAFLRRQSPSGSHCAVTCALGTALRSAQYQRRITHD